MVLVPGRGEGKGREEEREAKGTGKRRYEFHLDIGSGWLRASDSCLPDEILGPLNLTRLQPPLTQAK